MPFPRKKWGNLVKGTKKRKLEAENSRQDEEASVQELYNLVNRGDEDNVHQQHRRQQQQIQQEPIAIASTSAGSRTESQESSRFDTTTFYG